MDANNLIFALDIGTRTIIGIVGIKREETFEVLATETVAHQSRAMIDGQVHDIEKVAESAEMVKGKLENKLNITLTQVAIAAAGRVLKTKQVKIERQIDTEKEITDELIQSLEMEGVELSQTEIQRDLEQYEKTFFYCVGYDIINYYLNQYVITSLKGHKGKYMGADILATFLPHTVVDSLHTVMNRIGLKISSLTLEPIAAINVAIPKDLRLLNLALIDIGAGTSDIAITKNGSVIAYAMAPIAGDEITEMLCGQYLVDFNTGEKIKIALSSGESEVHFVDIMGIPQTKTVKEIKAIIKPAVENLAATIAQKITQYNQKAPNAVFLVGGGSQIEGLAPLIAEYLKLSPERVAVRERNIIQNLIIEDDVLKGPDAVTPIGIAVTAQNQTGQNFINVMVNEKQVRLFQARTLHVSDALILAGFHAADLLGKRGKSLQFYLNGEAQTIKGKYGESAEIYINGKLGNLETTLNAGDNIIIDPATQGAPAKITAGELKATHKQGECRIMINSKMVEDYYQVCEGDVITLSDIPAPPKEDTKTPPLVLSEAEEEKKMTTPTLRNNTTTIRVNGNSVVLNGDKKQYIFVDIFNYIDFDLSKPQGTIMLKLNGKKAGFTDLLTYGDEVEVYWESS